MEQHLSELERLSPTTLATANEERKSELASAAKSTTDIGRIPCWMSLDLHLLDIILSEETFEIKAWLCLFFKDDKQTFERIFDDDQLQLLRNRDRIDCEDLNASIRAKLPLKTSFIVNSSDMDIKRMHLQKYNDKENVWKLYIRFSASCSELLELSRFPFDAQFLNIKMVYRAKYFYFLPECPEWVKNDSELKLQQPINFTMKDSIKGQWTIEEPWIDLRQQRGQQYKFNFGVIRLRVRRNPRFFLVNGVLPLFLVICCSFASFVMPVEDYLGDKLAYIVTLLLTTAAFQYALSKDLPQTSETTMIDAYILYAYAILTAFAIQIAIVYQLSISGYESVALIVDWVTVVVFILIWVYRTWRFYYEWKYGKVDWEQLSHDEMREWSHNCKPMAVGKGQFKVDQ